MRQFIEHVDDTGRIIAIEPFVSGEALLNFAPLNKGSAFTLEEREKLGLLGRLPSHTETLETQISRLYRQYQSLKTPIEKNLFLYRLKQHNETTFYKLIVENLEEMLPIIYTPTIGEAVKQYSQQFTRPQGIHLAYPQRDQIPAMLANIDPSVVKLIILTDGEAILGIGDWGVVAWTYAGKLAVYACCGGINPRHILPIQLDVGTNNRQLLEDPMYLGWHHERIEGQAYQDFIAGVIEALTHQFPKALLHFEDFGCQNARDILDHYRDKACVFNDDMQGTGATATAAILAGLKATNQSFASQRIVFFGAGNAGTGIADQMVNILRQEGLTQSQARAMIWMIDRQGLLCLDTPQLTHYQKPYAKDRQIHTWIEENTSLQSTIDHVKPTILIGCSGQQGAFQESMIRSMAHHTPHPIILPLSNPTLLAEATPESLVTWTDGRAMIATGSPFQAVHYQQENRVISQCNNAFLFPGLGLGILACGAKRVTDAMIAAACHALAECAPCLQDQHAPPLPDIDRIHDVSKQIARSVACTAVKDQICESYDQAYLQKRIDAIFWKPEYMPYIHTKPSTSSH